MKIIVIIALIVVVALILLVISGRKNVKQDKNNSKCLTIENYLLIRDSPFADELSNYTIWRKENKLRFTRKGKGYTLFYLKQEEGQAVKLVGLDGYGVRDRAFLKYVCDLVNKITKKAEVED